MHNRQLITEITIQEKTSTSKTSKWLCQTNSFSRLSSSQNIISWGRFCKTDDKIRRARIEKNQFMSLMIKFFFFGDNLHNWNGIWCNLFTWLIDLSRFCLVQVQGFRWIYRDCDFSLSSISYQLDWCDDGSCDWETCWMTRYFYGDQIGSMNFSYHDSTQIQNFCNGFSHKVWWP